MGGSSRLYVGRKGCEMEGMDNADSIEGIVQSSDGDEVLEGDRLYQALEEIFGRPAEGGW